MRAIAMSACLILSAGHVLTSSQNVHTSLCRSECLGTGVESQKIQNAPGVWPWQSFKTAEYNPPELEINSTGDPLAPGLIFITPSNFNITTPALKQAGPFIMTDTGTLVWSGPISNSTNFRVQTYKGEPVVSFWSGLSTAGANVGHGYGGVTILDTEYKEIAYICPDIDLTFNAPGNYSCVLDLHESIFTDRGTILVSAYNVTQTDLSSVGGPVDGWIYDSQFYEVDIATNKVQFRWSAIEHVPVNASKLPLGTFGRTKKNPYDYFHINSVDPVGYKYLVNGRHTWQTYFLKKNGEVEWTIDGRTGGDFGHLPAKGHFEWQHDARMHNLTKMSAIVSWFNNYNSAFDNGTDPSNGLALQLTLPPNPAHPPKVISHLVAQPPIYADSQGSHQAVVSGSTQNHQTIGYGQIPVMKEYGPPDTGGSGILWTARFGADNLVQGYRNLKFEWSARPSTTPNLDIRGSENSNGCRKAFVSWNGATNVTAYAVYEGKKGATLCKVGEVQKKGFETGFGVSQPCVQVAALEGGIEVRRSKITCSS